MSQSKITRKPLPIVDPVFALIAEYKRLAKEFSHRRDAMQTVRSKEEKKLGNPLTRETILAVADATSSLWEAFNDAGRAKRKMGMRLARTMPTTPAGVAALVQCTRRDIMVENEKDGDVSDWSAIALKTAVDALTKMSAGASQ